MTQDEIIEMARQAKAIPMHKDFNQLALIGTENLEAFAKLVAAKKQEDIIKVIESLGTWAHIDEVVNTIRARGEQA